MTINTVTIVNRGTGSIEVHHLNCRDAKRHAEGASIWQANVATFADVVRDVYEPANFGYEPTGWRHYANDVVMMPCTPALPDDANEPQPSERTGRYNAAYARSYRAARRAERLRDEELYPVLIMMS